MSQTIMRIPFFRAGEHTDNSGNTHTITEEDLRAVVANYDPALYSTPLVVGHPEEDDPKYGTVTAIEYDEETSELVAIAEATNEQFADAVNAGQYGTDGSISVAWYPPNSAHNPLKDGSLYPRHIGFLGAIPPALKGLSPLQFADTGRNIWVFSEGGSTEPTPTPPAEPAESSSDKDKKIEELMAEIGQLRLLIAELKKVQEAEIVTRVEEENVEFCEGLIKSGKLLPAQRKAVITLLNAAPRATLEFNEKKKPFNALLKELLNSAPQAVEFSEKATKGTYAGKKSKSFEYDEGTSDEAIELDQAIREYMAEHNVTYTEAFAILRPQ